MNKIFQVNIIIMGLNKKTQSLDSDALRIILSSLSKKELTILQKNADLSERLSYICKLNTDDLIEILQSEYHMTVTDCENGDVWIDVDEKAGIYPVCMIKALEEKKLPYTGWYMPWDGDESESFVPWARMLLAQEVRSNLWIRYVEHKDELAEMKKNSEVDDMMALAWPGMYL